MHKLLIPFLLAFIVNKGIAQEKTTVSLTIEFQATKYEEGQIVIALFDNEDHYMKKALKSEISKLENKSATVVFSDLPKGEYSFSYYHDLNNNKNLDTNLIGIPKEPYGFSNSQKGALGPPSFDEAKITIDNDLKILISVK